ncbi:P12 family lipoprotein (plasmid) [Borreliella yangtzensis]|uniref:P12 family lipoprotein n=1 Tax=Borreliella yangtzensis TaxID=683292 RepID=UPI003BA14D79
MQQNLSENIKLDELINKIDISKNEVISASIIFNRAQERLKNSIIKRVKGKKEKSNALELSRQALGNATILLKNLESSLLIKIEVIGKKEEIKEFIKNAKAVVYKI